MGPVESIRGKTSSASFLVEYFIFLKVLEKLSQEQYFQSSDRNTAISLADKREKESFVGLPTSIHSRFGHARSQIASEHLIDVTQLKTQFLR